MELTYGSAAVDAAHVLECATDLVVLHGELKLLKGIISLAFSHGVQDKVSIRTLLDMRCHGSTVDDLEAHIYFKVGMSTATEPHPHPHSQWSSNDTHSYMLPCQPPECKPHPHTDEAIQHTSQNKLHGVSLRGCGSDTTVASLLKELQPPAGNTSLHQLSWPHPPLEKNGPHLLSARTGPHSLPEKTKPHPPPERTRPHPLLERTRPHPFDNPVMQRQNFTPSIEGSKVTASPPAPPTNPESAQKSLSKHQKASAASYMQADFLYHLASKPQASSESIELRATPTHQSAGRHVTSSEQLTTCSESSLSCSTPLSPFNTGLTWECLYCLALMSSSHAHCEVCGRHRQDTG